jgi:hypothetical protein
MRRKQINIIVWSIQLRFNCTLALDDVYDAQAYRVCSRVISVYIRGTIAAVEMVYLHKHTNIPIIRFSRPIPASVNSTNESTINYRFYEGLLYKKSTQYVDEA